MNGPGFVAAVVALFAVLARGAVADDRGAESAAELNHLGLQLARASRYAAAESLFVTALARQPGNPAALNNLGNLRALEAATDIAASFYVEAARHAPEDGGIRLNLGLALLDAGSEADAESAMALGLALAGGEEAGARLLGLTSSRPDSMETMGRARALNEARLRLMLKRAALNVPRAHLDSLARDPIRRKPVVSKSAAVRAAEPGGETVTLYWKD